MTTCPRNVTPTAGTDSGRVQGWHLLTAFSMMVIMLFGSVLGSNQAFAQKSQRIFHTETKAEKEPPPTFGRDLWFTMAQNYESQGGKYYDLYVTSPRATDVYIQVTNGQSAKYPIAAEQVLTFRIPLGWEVTSSGVVEDKGIHVWSKNADLTAYLLSRNPATSDGMYIIPSIGWGKENVVISYQSIARSTGWDYPSEFSVCANQDKSNILVTPTQDIRASKQPNVVLHQKGVPFGDQLNKGQAIQYQLTQFQNADEWDATGTTVFGDKAIGVIGASQCPDVPVLFPWCDHICDMVPPVRVWANTYYTAPFISRKGGDGYVVIGSKDGQTVYRTDMTGKRVHCVVNKYEPYFRHDIETPSRWESDSPFMLAQYINSTSWPGYTEGIVTNDGIGDPAVVVINPVEQYAKKIIFQTPKITGGAATFTNFVNIMVPKKAVLSTKLDNKLIVSNPRLDVDNQYDVYRISNVSPGAHSLVSDTGVGVYIYGYGSYDSYAWSGNFGTGKFDDPDTIAPAVKWEGECFNARVDFDDIHPLASKLSSFTLDSVYNMFYFKDPNFLDGTEMPKSFYEMTVDDINKEAILVVTIYDVAGNRRTVTSKYSPVTATIEPPLTNYGTGDPGKTYYKDITIKNTGTRDFEFTELKLLVGKDFKIESADRSPLKVGETRLISVSFTPNGTQVVTDSIRFGDDCGTQTVAVIGSGGAADFAVTDVDFGSILKGSNKDDYTQVTIVNLSKTVPVVISDITTDKPNFKYTGEPPLPITVPADGTVPVKFNFTAEVLGLDQAVGTFVSTEVGSKTNKLLGRGIEPVSNIRSDTSLVIPCPVPNETSLLNFALQSNGSSSQIVDRVTLAGDPSFKDLVIIAGGIRLDPAVDFPYTLQPGDEMLFNVTFDPTGLASGNYTATLAAYSGSEVLDKVINMSSRISIVKANASPATAVDFGVLPYGTAKQTQVFTLDNPGAEDLVVTNLQADATNSTSFAIETITGPNGETAFPITVPPGRQLTVGISFDPSTNATLAPQKANYFWLTNSCDPVGGPVVNGAVNFKGGSAQGFKIDPIFACATATSTVQVTSSNQPTLTDEVTAVNFISGNQANFVLTTPLPLKIQGGSTQALNFTFAPDAASAPRTYTAVVELTYVNSVGEESKIQVPIEGSAVGMTGNITSQFATINREALSGTEVTLPIEFSVTKNGINTDLTASAITGVKLEYSLNADIFSSKDIPAMVRNLPGDWQVDMTQSRFDFNVNGTEVDKLYLTLAGTQPLADGVTKLGDLNFVVALPKEDNVREVRLESATFLTVNGVELSQCFGSTTQSGEFKLIYACGDKLIQDLMNGKRTFAAMVKPITPNPVTSGNASPVTFTYAMRGEGPVSLAIYDMLGNEVSRVVDNVVHPVGVFEVRYDAARLPSGNYTVRFSSLGTTQSETLVVTK